MSGPVVPAGRDEQDQRDLDLMIRAAALESAVRSVAPSQVSLDDSVTDASTVFIMFRAGAFEHYLRTGEIALPAWEQEEPGGERPDHP